MVLKSEDGPGYQIFNDDEIISPVQEDSEDEENGSESFSDENEGGHESVSHGEAFRALETALLRFEKQEESCSIQLLPLK